jgi:hypothetical protein
MYLALIFNLICPLPPTNSTVNPKIFESKHFLSIAPNAAAFNLMSYKNGGEQAIKATYHVRVGKRCIEYKTGVVKGGQQVGGDSSIIYYHRFNNGGQGDVKIYVEVIE